MADFSQGHISKVWKTSRDNPMEITEKEYMFPSFSDGRVLPGKKTGRLPAMGWNSWNAFGCGNTEALTKAMADKIVELGLDKLGYRYLVLDDGCYRACRADGRLTNNTARFPGGFRALCFINLYTETMEGRYGVTADRILRYIGAKMVRADRFRNARRYRITDLWTGETMESDTGEFFVENPGGCDSVTLRISPLE